MKNIIILLIIAFSYNLTSAQQKFKGNLDKIRKNVHQSNSKQNLLKKLDIDSYDFNEDAVGEYDEKFKLKNEHDVLDMFREIIKARKLGELPQTIWDNLNVGSLLGGNVNPDGSINTTGFLDNSPMPGGGNFNFGDLGGKRGNSYANSDYGQNNDRNRNFGGQGHDHLGGNTWSVEATHSSSSNSDGSTTTSHHVHTSSVSSDSGYHSETHTEHYNNGDGTWVTTKTVSQTQPDGSNATSKQTTTKDEDGTVTTTTTVTKKDEDGNVVSEKTTEKEKKEEDTSENPMDDEFDNGNPPPGPIEMEMAVFRAVQHNSLKGGRTGDANDPRSTNDSDGNGVININDGSQHGYIEPKVQGGKLKENTRKINTTNPGRVNLKKVNKTIRK